MLHMKFVMLIEG